MTTTTPSFMQRFLAPADALLYEMDRKAALRAVLVDPPQHRRRRWRGLRVSPD